MVVNVMPSGIHWEFIHITDRLCELMPLPKLGVQFPQPELSRCRKTDGMHTTTYMEDSAANQPYPAYLLLRELVWKGGDAVDARRTKVHMLRLNCQVQDQLKQLLEKNKLVKELDTDQYIPDLFKESHICCRYEIFINSLRWTKLSPIMSGAWRFCPDFGNCFDL